MVKFLERALEEREIVTIPDGMKFMMAPPESEACAVKPRSSEIVLFAASSTNPLPGTVLDFRGVDIHQVLDV